MSIVANPHRQEWARKERALKRRLKEAEKLIRDGLELMWDDNFDDAEGNWNRAATKWIARNANKV